MTSAFWTACAVVALAGLLSGCASRSKIQPDLEFTKVSDVVYSPAGWPKALKADLYLPEGTAARPAVLLIHGGSWSSADHRWWMALIAHKLARRGIVVLNATYRGAPEFRYPAPVDDLREAVKWLRRNAERYHINSGKIATYGFSAGGQLAAMLGTLDGPPEVRVQAVVAVAAPTDLIDYPDTIVVPRYLGATIDQNPALYREASAFTHVTPDDPPVFQYQGTADTTVSPHHSEVFKAALDKAGIRNELHWVEGRGHAAMLIFAGREEDEAIDFLTDVLR